MNEYAVERLLGVLQSLTNEVQLFREAYVAHNSPKIEVKDEPQTENLFTDKYGDVWEWRGDAWHCISGDEPQTDCAWK